MSTITTITLTYNEEINIEGCIRSFKNIADRIIVLDGYSKDKTVKIAKELGAEVYQKDCGYFERFQFGMDMIRFNTDWIVFIDADERFTTESLKELKELCDRHANSDVNGMIVNYRVNFIGKELKYGASKLKKLRVFKPGTAFMENVKLDQHIRLYSGKLAYMKSYLLHLDYKGISIWAKKHVLYAEWAAEDYLIHNKKLSAEELAGLEKGARIKRQLKYNVYYKLPVGFRAWCFYVYRYYLNLGFLDGYEGKAYAFLQAYWYRFIVDIMINEKTKEDN